MSTAHSYSFNTGAFYMETTWILRYFKRPKHSKFSILDLVYRKSQPLMKWINSLAEIQEA